MDLVLLIVFLVLLLVSALGTTRGVRTLLKLSKLAKPVRVVDESGRVKEVNVEEIVHLVLDSLKREGMIPPSQKSTISGRVEDTKEDGEDLAELIRVILSTPEAKLPELKREAEDEILEALKKVDKTLYYIVYYRNKHHYGVRRIASALRKHGISISKTRVWELLKMLEKKGIPIWNPTYQSRKRKIVAQSVIEKK